MKILNIIFSYYPAIKFGGPIKSVYLLDKSIAKVGIKVDVQTTTEANKKKCIAVWLNGCLRVLDCVVSMD